MILHWYDIAMLIAISMILGHDLTARNRDYFAIVMDLMIMLLILGTP